MSLGMCNNLNSKNSSDSYCRNLVESKTSDILKINKQVESINSTILRSLGRPKKAIEI